MKRWLILLLLYSPCFAAPAFVQNGSIATNSGATASSVSVSYTPSASGNALIIGVSWGQSGSGAPTLSSCTATGYSFTVVKQQPDNTNLDGMGVCVATNIPAGAATITVSLSAASSGGLSAYPSEYSGVANPLATDGTNAANSTGTSASSGSAVTTTNGDLIYGLFGDTTAAANGFTAGSGFTRRFNDVAGTGGHNTSVATEDQVQSSAGSIAATATATNNTDRWIGILVTLKASAATVGPNVGFTGKTGLTGKVGII